MTGSEASDRRVLHAKYLDWCSARLADQFLALSPDEIYELAQNGSGNDLPETDASAPARVGDPSDFKLPAPMRDVVRDWAMIAADPASFQGLVARVTDVLLERLHLPSFDTWAEAYRTDPEPFDQDLLGFWREET